MPIRIRCTEEDDTLLCHVAIKKLRFTFDNIVFLNFPIDGAAADP